MLQTKRKKGKTIKKQCTSWEKNNKPISFQPSLTFTTLAIAQEDIAIRTGTAVGAREIDTGVGAELETPLLLVHLTFIEVCRGRDERIKYTAEKTLQPTVVPPQLSTAAWLTLAEAIGSCAAHVEARLTAAVLSPVNLGTAGLAAECGVIRHTPGWGSWGDTRREMGFGIRWDAEIVWITHLGKGSPTCLCLVLAGGSSPLLRAKALVLVQPLQARPTVLAGAARALTDLCKIATLLHFIFMRSQIIFLGRDL